MTPARRISAGTTRVARAVPAHLRHLNAQRVFETLLQRGPSSRADLTRETGISPPTMSKVMAALERAGLAEARPDLQVTAGRPSVVYRLAHDSSCVIGAVIDVRECSVAAAGLDGAIIEPLRVTFPTPSSYNTLLNKLASTIRDIAGRLQRPCAGVGISTPGLINRQEERVIFSPNLHQTDGRQIGQDLARRIEIETVLLQEEHGLCLAEMLFGAARGEPHFAMVDATEGLGMGVVSEGRFVEGGLGFGGELGHMTVVPNGEQCGCGNRGCLETVATDRAFARRLSRRLDRELTVEQAIDLVRANKVDASAELRESIEYLAIGLATVVNVFNPHLLLVYGRLYEAMPALFDQLSARVKERALRPSAEYCRLVRARGNKQTGAIATIIHHLGSTIDRRLGAALPAETP